MKSSYIKRVLSEIVDLLFMLVVILILSSVLFFQFMNKEMVQVFPFILIECLFFSALCFLGYIHIVLNYFILNNSVDVFYLCFIFVVFIFEIAYYFIFENFLGGTVGHKIFKCRVVNIEYKKLNGKSLFIRSVVKTLSKYLFCIPFLTIFFNKNNQTLHDILIKSIVIDE